MPEVLPTLLHGMQERWAADRQDHPWPVPVPRTNDGRWRRPALMCFCHASIKCLSGSPGYPRITTNEPMNPPYPTVKKKVKTCKRVQHLKIANDFMTHGNGSKPITTILGPALGESTSMYPCPILGHLGSQGCDSGPNHKDVYCLTCVKNIGVDMCNTWGPPQTILSVFCNASLRWRCTSAWLTPFAENGKTVPGKSTPV